MLVRDKDIARRVFNDISRFLDSNLKLKLNSKSRYYKADKGIDFCGYKIYRNYILLRRRCKKKIIKKVKKWNYLYINNSFNYNDFVLSYNSFLGHIKHSNSYYFRKYVEGKMLFRYLIK